MHSPGMWPWCTLVLGLRAFHPPATPGLCLPPAPSSAATTSRRPSLTAALVLHVHHGPGRPMHTHTPHKCKQNALPHPRNLTPSWLVTWTPGPKAGSMGKRGSG